MKPPISFVVRLAILGGVVFLAACVERRGQIYAASLTGGDYAVLSCEELETAQLSIRQRLAAKETAAFASNDSGGLLVAQQDQIAQARLRQSCPGGAVVEPITPRAILAQPEAAEQDAPTIDLVDATFLQVGTFAKPANADRVAGSFRAAGIDVAIRPITLGDRGYQRVVVGPLATLGDVATADRIAADLGLNDAFFAR